jgi:hypothetical protein
MTVYATRCSLMLVFIVLRVASGYKEVLSCWTGLMVGGALVRRTSIASACRSRLRKRRPPSLTPKKLICRPGQPVALLLEGRPESTRLERLAQWGESTRRGGTRLVGNDHRRSARSPKKQPTHGKRSLVQEFWAAAQLTRCCTGAGPVIRQ